jgi:hypothetical protein
MGKMSETPKTLTVREAAEATGLTEKAVRRRVERGVLPSVLGHDGRRRVLISALRDAGLLGTDGERNGAPMRHLPSGATPLGQGHFSELLSRLEVLAAENGRLRALTDGHERRERELEAALFEARARITEFEAIKGAARNSRRWFRRSHSARAATRTGS